MSRWAILLVLVLIVAGGGFTARALIASGKPKGPTYPAAWDARIAPYAKTAEKLRGLYFKHPVAVHFLSPEKFKKTVTSRREGPQQGGPQGPRQTPWGCCGPSA